MGAPKLDHRIQVPPRWGTDRDPANETDGEVLRRVARLMGFQLFPWQAHVADVSLEKQDGRYRYRTVCTQVGRQNGKSKLISARIAMEAMKPRHHIAYTAQDRNMARAKWEEHVEILESAPRLRKKIKRVSRVNGSEKIFFTNGSSYGIITPNAQKGGRGTSLDLVVIDEALTHKLELISALQPTLGTKENGQLWIVSNAGHPIQSELLLHYRNLGHAHLQDPSSDLAWFEWSPLVDEFDYMDEEVWYQAIPSLDLEFGVKLRAVREAANTNSPEIFTREWLNVWPAREAVQVVAPDLWDSLVRTDITIGERMMLSVDISVERHKAAIGASALVRGFTPVEVVDARDGTQWLLPRLIEIAKKWKAPVIIDGGSPAGSLIGELENAGIKVVTVSMRDYGKACGSFYDAINARTICHLDDPLLRAAITEASKRPLGDAWAWNRRNASNITPLVAVTLARYGVTNTPEEKPIVRSRVF